MPSTVNNCWLRERAWTRRMPLTFHPHTFQSTEGNGRTTATERDGARAALPVGAAAATSDTAQIVCAVSRNLAETRKSNAGSGNERCLLFSVN